MLTRIKSHAGSALSKAKNKQKYLPGKCRICLDDGEIPIFGANDISDDVTEFGNIKIRKDDNLPQYLCEACSTLLEAAILFRKTAKQSDEVLKRREYIESGTEDSDCKQEYDTYIKKEYLEFNLYSDSESDLDDFDRLKRNLKSEDETTNYNPTISEVDTQDSHDYKDFQTDLHHVKQEEGSINEGDSETIMIIVSDKDKIKQEQEPNEDDSSYIDSDNDEKTTNHNEQSLMKLLPNQRECEVCHSIVSKSAYKVHLKEHRKKYKEKYNKKYCKIECEICGKQVSKSYLKIHMKIHGTPEEQAERLIECTLCNKTFNFRYYTDHVRRMHPTKSEKKQMIQNIKRIETPSPTPNYTKCPVCDRNIKESDFKLHLEKHNGPLPRYVCEKCGKVFKHPSAFKTHCLTHGSELKYKCQFCPYRGLHQALLKIHVRTHTGDYNYKCTECPARFITKSNLTKHLNRHKGICAFKCEECNKGFYAKRDLEKHVRNIHMFVKHHVCEYCGKAYGHRDNMLSHQLKVHKREKIMPRGRMPSYLKAELMQFD
ncbi:hypothetical protein PYW07_010145 [Mythimna separata]|uniref:Uncharacterized protein n=1 Tax=Mythimna separata TaxID=271217 RepID=A0AAD7YI23_MYTSE|nr:hypothetical protein PYW07_010145 [Mythimna separata]